MNIIFWDLSLVGLRKGGRGGGGGGGGGGIGILESLNAYSDNDMLFSSRH